MSCERAVVGLDNLGLELDELRLKRGSIAQLQLSANTADVNTAEAALLCDDPTVGYALPTGTTTLVVSLAKVENLSTLSLLNRGVQGDVTVAVANSKLPANSSQWQMVAQQDLSPSAVEAKIGPSEAKYVRLTFNVREAGRIAALGIYAPARVSEFTKTRARQFAVNEKSDSFRLISNNVGDIHAKARALYVSSGSELAQANNMIDEQATSAFNFAADDASPVAVIDLGANKSLRRLSSVYSPRAASVQFYVLQALPGYANGAPENLKIDDATFDNLSPVGVVKDDGTRGQASVDFPAVVGRYVLVRWTGEQAGPLSVAEIAAFGSNADKTLLAANNQVAFGQVNAGDGKTMMDGKTMIEPKDEGEAPASPAEGPPPSLPQPPPFAFVPVLVPTSP